MRRLAVLGSLCLVLVACSAGGQRGGAPPGVVRFDLAADPNTLNPLFLHQDAASVEQQVARLAFEPFIDLDPSGRPIPALLDRIPTVANGGVSPDGRTITYHLRKGVRWSDGVPVSSADILFTLHAILDPTNPVRSHEGYDLIDRATAPNAQTVVFHLRRAWAPAVMTYFSYGFSPQFVLPAHVLRTQAPLASAPFNAAPTVGDGPFTFISWERGEALEYVANPLYWRGKTPVTRLDIRIIPDPQTNLVMLHGGSLDWNLIAPSQKEQLQSDRSIAFVRVPTSVIAGLVINTKHVPFNDVRVRRAIAMSIDREAISRKITLGAYPVTNMLQPQFSWAYDPTIREPGFDPSGADRLLDAAGWKRGPDGLRRKNGQLLELTYVQFPESVTGVSTASFAQEELRLRGFDAHIESITNAQLFLPRTGTLASGGFDVAYVPFTMGADPDDSSILGCHAPSNYAQWCNAQVDALEQRALAAPTQAARKVLYGKIARIVASDVPILYLFDASYIYAYRTRLHNFSPNAFLPTWNAAQWRVSGEPV
jgi:peptide/nickel transport system substrate-binding protein